MDSQRSFLIIALAIVSFFLWQEWQKDYGPKPVVAPVTQQQVSNDNSSASLIMDSPETPQATTPTA
jgi:YidC/Oxa1 family membrane protein insertase